MAPLNVAAIWIFSQPDVIVAMEWRHNAPTNVALVVVLDACVLWLFVGYLVHYVVVCHLILVRLVHVTHDAHGKSNLSKVNQIINPPRVQPPIEANLALSMFFGHVDYNAEFLSSY